MRFRNETIAVESKAYQLKEITQEVINVLKSSGIDNGLATVFCKHTSCSLVIMENADPSASRDLEEFIRRLVPENDPNFTHIYEGPDDMPSHIKMALTRTSESIPIVNGQLALGTWQGIFLWEHRAVAHKRNIIVSLQGL
ncbi:MAG: secondary thiamine-phosphate synthase enzyme YjbQ [Verrucomicrobia bacterium]|nr:secondary thiamine-phosphate synthase enzyme YjbQ [Verrucomicrobiota bacterium]